MTSHVDTFARDHLPPPEAQPEFIFELPSLQFPPQLNCGENKIVGEGGRLSGWPLFVPRRHPFSRCKNSFLVTISHQGGRLITQNDDNLS